MSGGELPKSLLRAFASLGSIPRSQIRSIPCSRRGFHQSTSKYFATGAIRRAETVDEVPRSNIAAPPISFSEDTQDISSMDPKQAEAAREKAEEEAQKLLKRLRVVPASASYFSAKPEATDDFITLDALLRKYSTLPVVPPGHAPRVAWKGIHHYKVKVNEPIGPARYARIIAILHRLNHIHPALMPEEVTTAMAKFKRDINPHDIKPRPSVIDEWGRSKGVGRRKTSSAVAWLVEGDGEVLINGQTLAQKFGRLHDRESAVWALKSTQRLDKYNIFGLVKGGGVTGQAEAMALAVAKALLVQEPALKPALRRGKPPPYFFYSVLLLRWADRFCDALRRGVAFLGRAGTAAMSLHLCI
ncbi:uncharacterized protein BDZ99DRAFT_458039 [Mytilinidion resinicola]|uniref:Ribosomal protein S5 domain 2-like protein n=1 Tax=Mytilinidion resinicola TaxID=574789 RepID=A0A6A6Z647_9PEZI|nr:uncharacterized protein BDZ99DRAFT_458039 [Mytilinidion resinicola]KAF2816143.1 hypothetical protein BDZ99DRAFT_458039 [Mytilinidion resinicola]